MEQYDTIYMYHTLITDRTQEDTTWYHVDSNPLWHAQFARDSPSLTDIGPCGMREREDLETGTPLTNLWMDPVSLFADKRSAWRRHGSAIRAYRKCTRRDAVPTRSLLLLVFLIPRRCRYVNLTLRPNCTEAVYARACGAPLRASEAE